MHLELAVPVPHDRRDRIGLDDQVVRKPLGLLLRGDRRRLVRIPNGDQICHPGISFRFVRTSCRRWPKVCPSVLQRQARPHRPFGMKPRGAARDILR
jgi:hypothetical protein